MRPRRSTPVNLSYFLLLIGVPGSSTFENTISATAWHGLVSGTSQKRENGCRSLEMTQLLLISPDDSAHFVTVQYYEYERVASGLLSYAGTRNPKRGQWALSEQSLFQVEVCLLRPSALFPIMTQCWIPIIVDRGSCVLQPSTLYLYSYSLSPSSSSSWCSERRKEGRSWPC